MTVVGLKQPRAGYVEVIDGELRIKIKRLFGDTVWPIPLSAIKRTTTIKLTNDPAELAASQASPSSSGESQVPSKSQTELDRFNMVIDVVPAQNPVGTVVWFTEPTLTPPLANRGLRSPAGGLVQLRVGRKLLMSGVHVKPVPADALTAALEEAGWKADDAPPAATGEDWPFRPGWYERTEHVRRQVHLTRWTPFAKGSLTRYGRALVAELADPPR